MRICFVGHVFHRRTRSSAFFVDLLRRLGQVDEFFSDPDGTATSDDDLVEMIAGSRYDCYVFWQTELVAERVEPLALGRSIIVPMYDSVAGKRPDWWAQFVKPQFISFSRAHHEMLQRLGCRTSHFQYFPDPGPAIERRDPDAVRSAFFWERRPRGSINARLVLDQCRLLGIERLHIHHAADVSDEENLTEAGDREGIAVTVSRWLDSPADLDALAGGAHFFFAPRPLEGIGMANLEAMARGQIVIAPDLPTINEYVAHRVSGLLYDPLRPTDRHELPRPDADAMRTMAAAARRRIVAGHDMWLADIERLLSIVADDGRRWSTTDYSAAFGSEIRRRAHERLN